jgi:defect-in-organelle-trafficking protein DotC
MRIKFSFIALASSLFLTSCTTTVSKPIGNTDSLNNLQQLSAPPPRIGLVSDDNSMREEALKNTALSLGAQAGLHWRSDQINATLKEDSKIHDQTYSFNSLLLDHNVLPPVLTEARQTLNLDSPDTIRIADQTYEIISQAKFVTTTPTWRDYLWMDYPQPRIPNEGILPHNNAEKKMWSEYSKKGWLHGIDQADEIYSENLSRLERDYKGMLLYRKLRTQNIVSAPFVARTELGITGGGSNLNVNDQILRITALPALQPNSARWKPILNQEPQ